MAKFYPATYPVWNDFINYLSREDAWNVHTNDWHKVLRQDDFLPNEIELYLSRSGEWFGEGPRWQFHFFVPIESLNHLEKFSETERQNIFPDWRGAFYESWHHALHNFLKPKVQKDIILEPIWSNEPARNLARAATMLKDALAQAKNSEHVFWANLSLREKHLLNFYWKLSMLLSDLQNFQKQKRLEDWQKKLAYWDQLKDDVEKRHVPHQLFEPFKQQYRKQQDFWVKGGRPNLYQNFVDSISKKQHFS